MTKFFIRAKPVTMTAEAFALKTGRFHQQDDLERVNCELAGSPGHTFCGWNHCTDRPCFESTHHKEDCTCPQSEKHETMC